MVLTSGHWWRGGWHDKWNFGARINGVPLCTHCKPSTHQAVEYQLESDAYQRNPRKLHTQANRTQQLSLLDDTVSVQYIT